MGKKLTIDPVTRIEGHGKVTVQLDDDNNIIGARLHVVEFRGFEKFVQGHPYWEAPMFLQRICGICFVSHHLCGAKVLDDMIGAGYSTGVQMLPAPEKIRRLGHYFQQLQSHVTAYYYLIAPEMLFGIDAAPEKRNVLGMIEENPEMVKRVVALRKWGQEGIKLVFGKKMHGIASIPGGVNHNISKQDAERFLKGDDGLLDVDTVIKYASEALDLFYEFHDKNRDMVDRFADVPALNMCLVDDDGNVDYYHGKLRITDEDKNVVEEFDYHDYMDYFAEATEEWSYMKFPYLKKYGRERGSVRVGPLARVNVTRAYGSDTPLAQAALEKFHDYNKGKASNKTLHTNWARAIEILHSAELIKNLLNDPDLQKEELKLTPPKSAWTGEGVAVVEAPRGSLLHHYRADEKGEITFCNLVVSTTQNNTVMNRTVLAVAEEYLGGQKEITEGMMNAIEVGIRAYDPCLSCATHATNGNMPLDVQIVDAEGKVVDSKKR